MATMTIRLFCAAGMSTSLLVNKMKEAARAQGKDYDIAAYSLGEFDREYKDADVILLGPQVRYALGRLQASHPEKVIVDIPMQMYGLIRNDHNTVRVANRIFETRLYNLFLSDEEVKNNIFSREGELARSSSSTPSCAVR